MRYLTFLILFMLGLPYAISAQTSGSLAVYVTTSQAGGGYAPKNIVAIWIEDGSGQFVKTLLAYAASRKTHLNIWEGSTTAAGSPFNVTDAITGPTLNNHTTHACIWDGQDYNDTLVPDGIYRLRMELTDKNATGNFSTFLFDKGPLPDNQTPTNAPSFSSVSMQWAPTTTASPSLSIIDAIMAFPNPTIGLTRIKRTDVLEIKAYSLDGKEVGMSKASEINLSAIPPGVYLLRVSTNKHETYTLKIVRI